MALMWPGMFCQQARSALFFFLLFFVVVISPQPFFQVCLWRTGSLRLSFYGDILEYRYTRIVNEINEQPMQREVAAVYIYHKT